MWKHVVALASLLPAIGVVLIEQLEANLNRPPLLMLVT